MRADQPLRLYANPLKLFLYLLGAGGLALISLLMLQNTKVRANGFQTALAYGGILFFGLGTVVILVMNLTYVVFRRPMLEIDARHWNYTPPLILGSQAVNWQDIGHIAVYRQTLRRTQMYYLVVHAKDPDRLPHARARALAARFYPSLGDTAMSIPLNALFVRMTSAQSARLRERIVTAFAYEIQLYGVQVSSEVREL